MLRPQRGVAYWLVPHDLLCLLSIESKTISTGEVPPTIDCALLNQLLINTMPFKPVYNLILWKHYLI